LGLFVINNIDFTGLTVVALSVMLISVVWTDIKTHRISNAMVMMIIVLGLLSQLAGNGVDGVMQGLAGLAVGLALFLPFYLGGGMGAGDVKLLASIGTILGPLSILLAGGIALIAGIPLALFCLGQRYYRIHKQKQRMANSNGEHHIAEVTPYLARKERLPYAAAIAVGTIAGLWHSGQMQQLIGALV
jgi:prepilin peptidase CpaA